MYKLRSNDNTLFIFIVYFQTRQAALIRRDERIVRIMDVFLNLFRKWCHFRRIHALGRSSLSSVARLVFCQVCPLYNPGVLIGTLFDLLIKFFQGRGLLLNLGDKETIAPGFQRPDVASVLRRAFRLLSARVTKSFVASKYSKSRLLFGRLL